jgi:hypothetical protein
MGAARMRRRDQPVGPVVVVDDLERRLAVGVGQRHPPGIAALVVDRVDIGRRRRRIAFGLGEIFASDFWDADVVGNPIALRCLENLVIAE